MSEVPQAKFGTHAESRVAEVFSDRRRPLLPARAPDGDHALRKRE